jgi:hypothetical protein
VVDLPALVLALALGSFQVHEHAHDYAQEWYIHGCTNSQVRQHYCTLLLAAIASW